MKMSVQANKTIDTVDVDAIKVDTPIQVTPSDMLTGIDRSVCDVKVVPRSPIYC